MEEKSVTFIEGVDLASAWNFDVRVSQDELSDALFAFRTRSEDQCQ